MINDPIVSLNRVISSFCWVIAWAFIVAAWVAYLLGCDDLGVMLFLSCLPAAWTAALLAVKTWITRLCSVMRANSGERGPTPVR